MKLTRRGLGLATSALVSAPLLARPGLATPFTLIPAPASIDLVDGQAPPTLVWAYNGKVPGPLLRFRQGERLQVEVENGLPQPTSVHWHGQRPPVAMDGVPHLSHQPIQPGERFVYDFSLLDAGTYWYHPHVNSSAQVGRGLYGALIVDEAEPVPVDRDVLWVLDDWRMDAQARLAGFDGNRHDQSHGGRIGNSVTVNGSINERFKVRPGERIRLRLLNAANARTFAARFDSLKPWLIALDGHPVPPIQLPDQRIVLGSGQRADLILDCTGEPGDVEQIIDDAYGAGNAYSLMRLVHNEVSVKGLASNQPPQAPKPNPVAEPDLRAAQRHRLVFEGGAMGGLRGAKLEGTYKGIRELAEAGKFWAINGTVAADGYGHPPLLQLSLGQTYVLQLVNQTAFDHPIHLHGHTFRVLARNGEPEPLTPLRDTVLVRPDETVEIAFVADNPGDWMLHCHILEHQAAAMMGVVRVG